MKQINYLIFGGIVSLLLLIMGGCDNASSVGDTDVGGNDSGQTDTQAEDAEIDGATTDGAIDADLDAGDADDASPDGGYVLPYEIANFQVRPGNQQLRLKWTNPTDSSFAGVLILRKNGSDPTGPTDPDAIIRYNGLGLQGIAEYSLDNGQAYYYKAFCYDSTGNLSAGVSQNGSPVAGIWGEPVQISPEGFNDSIWYPSLAIDQKNRRHVSYTTRNGSQYEVRYILLNGNVIQNELIDSSNHFPSYNGAYTSIAIDRNDKVQICYSCRNNTPPNRLLLRYAVNEGGGPFTNEVVETVPTFSVNSDFYYCSMTVDQNNGLHFAYQADVTHKRFGYSFKNGSTGSYDKKMAILDLGDDIGYFTSLAIDQNNLSHSIYYKNDDNSLYHVIFNGTGLAPYHLAQMNSSGFNEYTAIGFDQNNTGHLLYFNGILKYSSYADAAWSSPASVTHDSPPEYSGKWVSMKVDPVGNLHAAYIVKKDNQNLMKTIRPFYVNRIAGIWGYKDLFPSTNQSEEFSYTAIALDQDNYVHIVFVYRLTSNYYLKYVNNIP